MGVKGKNKRTLQEPSDSIRKINIRITGLQKKKKEIRQQRDYFKQIIDGNFPHLWKELDSQIH